jgi:hypothetical protein
LNNKIKLRCKIILKEDQIKIMIVNLKIKNAIMEKNAVDLRVENVHLIMSKIINLFLFDKIKI